LLNQANYDALLSEARARIAEGFEGEVPTMNKKI
jgi:hypothetical protein